MASKSDDSDPSKDPKGNATVPASVRKKTYRVVESRYLNFAQSGYKNVVNKTSRDLKPEEVAKDDSLGACSLQNETTSGAKISTPRKNVRERPKLDCSNISSIHNTLKDMGNLSILNKNQFKEPLQEQFEGDFNHKKKENFQPDESKLKAETTPLWDTSSHCDLEILYNQYLMANYMAEYSGKQLEIQDKEHVRLLTSLADENKKLADQLLELEKKYYENQINEELNEAVHKQLEVLEPLREFIPKSIEVTTIIKQLFEIIQNQMILRNIDIKEDYTKLEEQVGDITSQLIRFVDLNRKVQPMLDKLEETTNQVLKSKLGAVGNEMKILQSSRSLVQLAGYQQSLLIDKRVAKEKENALNGTNEIDELIYNW